MFLSLWGNNLLLFCDIFRGWDFRIVFWSVIFVKGLEEVRPSCCVLNTVDFCTGKVKTKSTVKITPQETWDRFINGGLLKKKVKTLEKQLRGEERVQTEVRSGRYRGDRLWKRQTSSDTETKRRGYRMSRSGNYDVNMDTEPRRIRETWKKKKKFQKERSIRSAS